MSFHIAGLWLQAAGALLIVVVLLMYALQNWWSLYRFVAAHFGLVSLLGLLYALVFAQVGTSLGIHYLFWHEDFPTRVGAAAGVTLLLGVLGTIAYYLDIYPWATEEKTRAWLSIDEYLKGRSRSSWSRRLTTPLFRRPAWHVSGWVRENVLGGTRGARPEPYPEPRLAGRPPTSFEVVLFCLNNAAFDPISLTPLAPSLETWGHQLRLQRFLRACRTPFLLSLLAPAALPALFTQVPRTAPTGGPGIISPRVYDVALDLRGYAIGLLAWWLGIVCGVAIIRGLIAWSGAFHRKDADYEARGEARPDAPGSADWVRADRACRWATEGCPLRSCPRSKPGEGGPPPDDCRARRMILLSIFVYFAIFLVVYVAAARVPFLYNSLVSPAMAICATIGVLAMAVSTLDFIPRLIQVYTTRRRLQKRMVQLPLVLFLVFWLGIANNHPYKYRFEEMLYDDAKLVDLRERVDRLYFDEPPKPEAVNPGGLVPDGEARRGWEAASRPGDRDRDAQGRPKLVLVAVTGGAARSAFWTAVVLDRLERTIPEFGPRVRIISGASGGMLGTACYVKHRQDVARNGGNPDASSPGDPSDWVDAVPLNSMEPLAKHIALSEIWRSMSSGPQVEDRGIVLERDWSDLRFPIKDLAPLEKAGKIPSLIFSPMLVEDGRRLLISNLDLFRDAEGKELPSTIVKSSGSQLLHTRTRRKAHELGTGDYDYSLSGIEFFRVFPHSDGLLLSTAVRMSATFPYVSPAVNLPTIPPRRVVDAGYYDNYGIQVAAAWVRQNRDWLAEHTSGVLLLQIRDSVSDRERLDIDDARPGFLSWGNATRGFQFLTSPVDGFTEARYTSSAFRNDEAVESLNRLFADRMKGLVEHEGDFFTTAIFENSAIVSLDDKPFWEQIEDLIPLESSPPGADAPGPSHREGVTDVTMTWNLTRAERKATLRAIPEPPADRSRWQDELERTRAREYLAGQVFATISEDELKARARAGGKSLDRLRAELIREGKLCHGPGPERDLRFRRLVQLRNYERLRSLEVWWKEAGRRKPVPAAVAAKSD